MNKTIIININGIIFHIEEDAYEALKNYMTDVKRHFANAEDSLEITTDIENRIAEMFTDVLTRENRQVIVTADVTAVIEQMGTVQDFETGAGENENSTFNSYQNFTDNRKLFRDPDDHLIGGVCAGIANYFDVETVWVRIAFAVAFCFGGTGLMLYIILWIVLPRAVNRADRMAMKGEKRNLEGFKRNFEEELKNVHATFRNAGQGAKPFVYKARDFTGDFFSHFRIFLQGAAQILLKMFGVLILIICFSFFVSAVVGFIALVVSQNDIYHIFPLSVISSVHDGYNSMLLFFSAFALIVIPLFVIIMLTLKVIFNRQGLNRSAGYTLLIVWIGSLSILMYDAAKITRQFRDEESFTQTINIKPNKSNVYHLQLNDIRFLNREDSVRMGIDHSFNGNIIVNNDDFRNSFPENVDINIEKSDVQQIALEETFRANGYNERDALTNARNSAYHFEQKDSLLVFDRRISLINNVSWRNQHVELTLKVPYGTELVIDEKLLYLIRNDIKFRDCKKKNNAYDWTTAPYMMTDSGLQCRIITAPVVPETPPLTK